MMMSKLTMFVLLLFITGIGLFLGTHFNLTVWLDCLQQSPCACEKCLSEDKLLLMQRFNSSVTPFLSVNYNLSEEAFNWWKHLQYEKCSFSTYKTTVDRLFQMFPPTPDLIEPSPDRCRTCAVVGNSINLKGSHYGPLIDFHDVIIRMNFGHISGYEEDVGTRTTHRVMYPESAMHLDNSTHLVLFPFKIQDLEWLIKTFTTAFTGKSHAAVKPKFKANKDLVMVVNPAFMMYVHNTWLEKKGRYPSTGFMALVLALHICDEVHVFGFGADSDGNWSHYWEKLKNKKLGTGPHPGQYEYDIIQQLAEQQKVQFFKGW